MLASSTYGIYSNPGDTVLGTTTAYTASMMEVYSCAEVFGGPGDTLSGNHILDSFYIDPMAKKIFWQLPSRAYYNWDYWNKSLQVANVVDTRSEMWHEPPSLKDFVEISSEYGKSPIYMENIGDYFYRVGTPSSPYSFLGTPTASPLVLYANGTSPVLFYLSKPVPLKTKAGTQVLLVNQTDMHILLASEFPAAGKNFTLRCNPGWQNVPQYNITGCQAPIADIDCAATYILSYEDEQGCMHICAPEAENAALPACPANSPIETDCTYFIPRPTSSWIAGDGCTYSCTAATANVISCSSIIADVDCISGATGYIDLQGCRHTCRAAGEETIAFPAPPTTPSSTCSADPMVVDCTSDKQPRSWVGEGGCNYKCVDVPAPPAVTLPPAACPDRPILEDCPDLTPGSPERWTDEKGCIHACAAGTMPRAG